MIEKYRYFTLRDDEREIHEYYRVWGNKYEWWDVYNLDWATGQYKDWTERIQMTKCGAIEETSPLEMVVLLGKEAVRMLYEKI